MEPADAKPKPTMEEIYEKELVSKRHNCTDIICLVIFIVLCLIQLAFSILIFVKGHPPFSQQPPIRPQLTFLNLINRRRPDDHPASARQRGQRMP